MKGGLLITLLRKGGGGGEESKEEGSDDVSKTVRTTAARAIREAISAGDDEKLAEALHEFVVSCE